MSCSVGIDTRAATLQVITAVKLENKMLSYPERIMVKFY